MKKPDPMPRCTAHSKQTGLPCKQPPIPGGTVCRWHGGDAPQVRKAAMNRLLEAIDPVTAEYIRLALNAESEAVRARAIEGIMDRAGLVATQKAEVTVHDGDSDLDREIAGLLEAMARREQGEAPLDAAGSPESAHPSG